MSRALVFGLSLGSLALSGVACGGIAVFDEGAGGEAGNTQATSGATRSSSGTTSGGTPNLVPTIQDVRLTASCKPLSREEDPLSGAVDIRYDNVGAGSGQIAIVSAQVVFASRFEGWVFPINLSPLGSGAVGAGSPVTRTHDKVATPGDASFVCSLCGMPSTLTVRYDNGAETSSTVNMACLL